jgi:serine/threonine protein kinase
MDLIEHKLGRYEIIEKLASGGMADVYRARQESLDRDVAIKVLPAIMSRDETFRARFEQEARAVAQLHHPNILTVFDYGDEDGMAYLVMEYAAGGTLKDRIAGPLPLDEAIEIASQLACALDYAHQRGLVHRDVKPSNVLLDDDGRPLLSDFGLVKMAADNKGLTQSGVSIGTPEYMSPEQSQGLSIDHRSDIYSLGVILYELVTGQPPYTADTPLAVILKHITERPPPPRELRPELPSGVEAVILKAMAKVPEQRYAGASEMVSALRSAWEDAQSGGGAIRNAIRGAIRGVEQDRGNLETWPDRPAPPASPPQGRKRRPAWIAGAALALLIVGVGLVWALVPGVPGLLTSFWTAPTATATLPSVPLVVPTATIPRQATPTSTLRPTATPVPPVAPAPTSTATPSPTPTFVPTSTSTPTPSPTPTSVPWAVARLSSSVFEGPRSETRELAVVFGEEKVEILGRTDELQYGRWLYIQTGKGVVGFVYEPRFEYTIDWDSLPVQEVKGTAPLAGGRLVVSAGTLRIEHVWPGGECKEGGGWTAVFEVKISGGNGWSYKLYWDQEAVSYTVKAAEPDVAIIRRPVASGMIVGTVWVESGGQRVGEPTSARVPHQCN